MQRLQASHRIRLRPSCRSTLQSGPSQQRMCNVSMCGCAKICAANISLSMLWPSTSSSLRSLLCSQRRRIRRSMSSVQLDDVSQNDQSTPLVLSVLNMLSVRSKYAGHVARRWSVRCGISRRVATRRSASHTANVSSASSIRTTFGDGASFSSKSCTSKQKLMWMRRSFDRC